MLINIIDYSPFITTEFPSYSIGLKGEVNSLVHRLHSNHSGRMTVFLEMSSSSSVTVVRELLCFEHSSIHHNALPFLKTEHLHLDE